MSRSRLTDVIDPTWNDALTGVKAQLKAMEAFLEAEVAAGRDFLPAPENVLRALSQPLDRVRVLIVGQDPYPTPGYAVGLSFSVAPDVAPLPRSLQNIYRELVDDVGLAPPASGDLTPWTQQGVLLLNRVLSVQPWLAGSHHAKGWEPITDAVIAALVQRRAPLVAILWGRRAQALIPALGDTAIIATAHPSPLSAARGFFGSRPFSRANAALVDQGASPIDWSLPTA